ncbi:hypothetical protein C8Q76DRAFT_801144 [Earliella scabrosa]|nr:hypothetical protein C8Q76DRAFT_801144 [Earliella scabrosa]
MLSRFRVMRRTLVRPEPALLAPRGIHVPHRAARTTHGLLHPGEPLVDPRPARARDGVASPPSPKVSSRMAKYMRIYDEELAHIRHDLAAQRATAAIQEDSTSDMEYRAKFASAADVDRYLAKVDDIIEALNKNPLSIQKRIATIRTAKPFFQELLLKFRDRDHPGVSAKSHGSAVHNQWPVDDTPTTIGRREVVGFLDRPGLLFGLRFLCHIRGDVLGPISSSEIHGWKVVLYKHSGSLGARFLIQVTGPDGSVEDDLIDIHAHQMETLLENSVCYVNEYY